MLHGRKPFKVDATCRMYRKDMAHHVIKVSTFGVVFSRWETAEREPSGTENSTQRPRYLVASHGVAVELTQVPNDNTARI